MHGGTFRQRFLALARRYPRLKRGRLGKPELLDLARRYARSHGYDLIVRHCPWPWYGTIRRMDQTIVITIDSRQNARWQLGTLAHEVGHLVLGHYLLEPFWADATSPANREEESEADAFAALVTQTFASPLHHLGPDQLELL